MSPANFLLHLPDQLTDGDGGERSGPPKVRGKEAENATVSITRYRLSDPGDSVGGMRKTVTKHEEVE